MINALRVPHGMVPLDFTADILKKIDGGKVCAIVPTARALRTLANEGFKTVELFSIKDFTGFADNSSGIFIPKQLRPFYLRKAAEALSKDDRITVFRSDKTLFLENFMAFAQVSAGIFSFYRELAAEMVDIQTLAKAGKYTDYELQITVLERLWQKYIEIIADAGYSDEWESYKTPTFRSEFISRYDEIIFLIGGYLTKYELEQLKQVGEIKKITLLFNYAGKRHRHHELYEKYLGITLDDRPAPVFSPNKMKIFSCPSMAAQLELITKQIFYFKETQGIGFKKMAVIIPDEKVKSYFLRLDPYNLFDVTSNENISSRQFFQILQSVLEMASKIINSANSMAEIADIIKILSQPLIKEKFQTDEAVKKYYAEIKNGKIYAPAAGIMSLSFFNDYAASLINPPEKLTPSSMCVLIKQFAIKLKNLLSEDESHNMAILLNQLEMLETIYGKIDEKIAFNEAVSLIMDEVSQIKIRTPKGKVAVMGILESRNLAFDVVFLPAMNEDVFPPANKKDMFLNTEIRKELDLPTFIDRENLMKNYLLQITEQAAFVQISYIKNGSARRRSRFIEEIAVQNKLSEEYYGPKEISLLRDKKIYFSENGDISVEKNDDIMEKLAGFIYSPSAFNDYLICPLRFYLKNIAIIYPAAEPETKVSPAFIGIAFHKAMERLHREKIKPDSTDFIKIFRETFNGYLTRSDAYKYNSVEQFRTSEAEKAIEFIALEETKRLEEGWRAEYTEQSIKATYENWSLKGFIDRIDKRGEDYEIIDYKFKDVKFFPEKYDMEKQDDLQMPFYALLFELHTKKTPVNLYHFDLKTKFKLVKAFDMSFFDDFKKFLIKKLTEISSTEKSFCQTEKVSKCVYCDYAPVCGRE